jgi:two-component system KDP operon response regulator KdpE
MSNLQSNILVADPDIRMRRFLRGALELVGYCVSEAVDGNEAIRLVTAQGSELVILELNLPDMDGAEVIERLRSWSDVPIIIVSSKWQVEDKVRAFELGADDFVTKPFSMDELLARTKARLCRGTRRVGTPSILELGRLKIDFKTRTVCVDDAPVKLSAKEYQFLQVLGQNPGSIVTYEEVLTRIWGSAHANDIHYARTVAFKIRKIIEIDATRPEILLTEPNVGYRLGPPVVTVSP